MVTLLSWSWFVALCGHCAGHRAGHRKLRFYRVASGHRFSFGHRFLLVTVPPPLEFHHSDFHGNLRDTVTLAGYRIFPGNTRYVLTTVGPLGMPMHLPDQLPISLPVSTHLY